jgi:HEAT repeat protein
MPGAEAEVAPLLSDPDPDVRLATVAALSEVGTAEAAAALIDALAREDLPPARLVERLGSAWAAPVVHAALERELSQSTEAPRAQLAQALGLASYSAAEPCLLALLERGSREERISAARALGRAGSERSIPALMGALASEDWVLRAQAARSLGQLHADVAVEELTGCLSDRAWWVRKQAGHALRHLGGRGLAALQATVVHADRYARERAEQELRVAAVLEAAKLAPPEEPEGAAI